MRHCLDLPEDNTMTHPRPTWRPLPRVAASTLLPLGALAAGFAQAQTAPAETPAAVLPTVRISASAESEQGKDTLKPGSTRIGKGTQAVKDIPQSITVLTERLMNDRNLDDFKEVLRSTAGVTFLAGETGEEDVRLRGFSLQQAGDIYIDGMRDSALYERDTFNNDRVEVLKGSASMLFGRGSTGGVVNQVSKEPLLLNQHEVNVMAGSGQEFRLTGDFNIRTGDDAALRLNAMTHVADKDGAKIDKRGFAPTYRWGIGTADEFSIGAYGLQYDNRPNYNHPWFIGSDNEIITVLPAGNYYGLRSDYHRGSASSLTLAHTHRFGDGSELRSRVRAGEYERDLWVSAIRFGTTNGAATTVDNVSDDTLITRNAKGRYALSRIATGQVDYSTTARALGLSHEILTGVDFSLEKARRNNSFAGTASGLTTTVGTPNDGDWRADTRGEPALNHFTARTLGVYAQDTASLNEQLKLVAGLRLDRFHASYQTVTTTAGNGTVTPGTSFERTDHLWSPRLGLIFQPGENTSVYASWGTSFNTSGDTYQYAVGAPNAKDARTPPEKSRNFEIGAKFDLFNKRALLGLAAFRSEKYNERNTDPDSAATQQLLSGKRHASGLELNLAGRITPNWEIFYNHTWIPDAVIDKSNQALASNGGGAQVEGDRPGLTPEHSASLWTTYRVTPKVRLGAGLNHRGEQHPEGQRLIKAKAFTTADAMVEYTFDERFSAKLNVTNLTDELYADTLYRGFYGPGAPRTVQLSLKAMFY